MFKTYVYDVGAGVGAGVTALVTVSTAVLVVALPFAFVTWQRNFKPFLPVVAGTFIVALVILEKLWELEFT